MLPASVLFYLCVWRARVPRASEPELDHISTIASTNTSTNACTDASTNTSTNANTNKGTNNGTNASAWTDHSTGGASKQER